MASQDPEPVQRKLSPGAHWSPTPSCRSCSRLSCVSLIYAGLFPDSFATTGTMLNMARVAGILLAVAIAQSFALIVGGFDISVGANDGG